MLLASELVRRYMSSIHVWKKKELPATFGMEPVSIIRLVWAIYPIVFHHECGCPQIAPHFFHHAAKCLSPQTNSTTSEPPFQFPQLSAFHAYLLFVALSPTMLITMLMTAYQALKRWGCVKGLSSSIFFGSFILTSPGEKFFPKRAWKPGLSRR